MASVCREVIERAAEGDLLNQAVREKLVKARLIELAMQDENLQVALGAAKQMEAELGIGGTNVGVAVQVNLKHDPQVIEALRSLGLEDADSNYDK